MNSNIASEQENSAWASLNTFMTAESLKEFCADTETLFRINPYLEFLGWQDEGDNRARIHIRNTSNKHPVELDTVITVSELDDGYQVEYADGIKLKTTFQVSRNDNGAMLKIIDEYRDIDEADEESLGKIDKSIVAWARDLQDYIFRWQRWKWLAPWRWYMRGPWKRMKPPARRITYMLFWVTFAELLGFILVFVIFWYDFDEFFKL